MFVPDSYHDELIAMYDRVADELVIIADMSFEYGVSGQWSPDSRMYAFTKDHDLMLWDVEENVLESRDHDVIGLFRWLSDGGSLE